MDRIKTDDHKREHEGEVVEPSGMFIFSELLLKENKTCAFDLFEADYAIDEERYIAGYLTTGWTTELEPGSKLGRCEIHFTDEELGISYYLEVAELVITSMSGMMSCMRWDGQVPQLKVAFQGIFIKHGELTQAQVDIEEREVEICKNL